MLKRQRMRTITSFILAAAMTVLTVSPVMGEEIMPEISEGIVVNSQEESNISETDLSVTTSEYGEAELCSDSDSTYYGYNTSESANTYCGIIYVRDDGLYDRPKEEKGNTLDIPGVTYDPKAHIISLNNVNIGCVYDGPLDRNKMGAFVFCCEEDFGKDPNTGEEGPEFKIVLKGHNYIGGYSTYERKSLFYTGNLGYYIGGNPLVSSFLSTKVDRRGGYLDSLTIEGDGDLTIHYCLSGEVTPLKTHLPIWYSWDDWSNFRKADEYETGLYYEKENWKGWHFNPYSMGSDGSYYAGPYHIPNIPNTFCDVGAYNSYHPVTVKIGGEKPNAPDIPQSYITVSKNLGIIGGHSVSVCHTDKVVYNGKRHVFGGEDTKKKIGDMDLDVYIDDKFYEGVIECRSMNNENSNIAANGKDPCFAFGFPKSSGLDQSFIKALDDYFKNKDNWIKFTIDPCDIKCVDSFFYRQYLEKRDEVADDDDGRSYVPKRWIPKREKEIKKNLKIKGDTIKKINLREWLGYEDKNEISHTFSKKLKWDKKYNESNPNLKKDFHASVSGDCIVITGQGNFTGTVIVANPYKNPHRYYEGMDDQK